MVNKYGKKEDLIERHNNRYVSYQFMISDSGLCHEFVIDERGKEITYRNSEGVSRGFDKPKQEINEEDDARRMRAIAQNGNNGEHYDLEDVKLTKNQHFEKVINDTLAEVKELLIVKGREYRRNDNVYHNFDQGAKIKGITPEKVLDGFLLKHEVSISDMTNDLDKGIMPSKEKVEEKFNDNIIYLLIKKAMILNRIK
tara:strand:+ start:1806 stop:2399 length:594 start_codon:yes stop_codon:yes gene_type:complete